MPSLQYACFWCRKSFKRPQEKGAFNRFMTSEQQQAATKSSQQKEENRDYKCPDCGKSTHYMGIDFKAPKQTDLKAWQKAEEFIRSGKVFHRDLSQRKKSTSDFE